MGIEETALGVGLFLALACCYASVSGLRAGLFLGVDPHKHIRLHLGSDLLITLFLSLGILAMSSTLDNPLTNSKNLIWTLITGFSITAFYLRGRVLKEIPRLPKSVSEEEPLHKLREGVLEFAEGIVRDELVPINDVFKVSEEDTLEEILEREEYKPYSRIPVYRGERDNIIGIIYAKELLQAYQSSELAKSGKTPIKPHIREAFFVPEVMEQTILLQEFQKKKIQMAIVVDEYGVNTGIVTLEDLIETIVGEVQDGKNDDDNFVHSSGYREWVLDAMIELDDCSDLVGIKFESDTVETLGGFVFQEVGFLPSVGDILVVKNLEFTVEEMDGYRIRKIKIRELDS